MASVLIVAHSACLTWASVGHVRYKITMNIDRELTSIDVLDYFCPCISNTAQVAPFVKKSVCRFNLAMESPERLNTVRPFKTHSPERRKAPTMSPLYASCLNVRI
jgi:hypothetical protein